MKIQNKHYFTLDQVIKTNDLYIILEYIKDKKKISKKDQDKLVNIAILSKDPIFIKNLAIIIQNLEKENSYNLNKLVDAIIEMNDVYYILLFSRSINKISVENQNKLVDAMMKSGITYYNGLTNKDERIYNPVTERYYRCKHICTFVCHVNWLSDNNIEKLADFMIKTKEVNYICKFLSSVNISREKMLDLEKYMLKNYKKDLLAKTLKKLNNVELINLIYGSESVLDDFLNDFNIFEKDNLDFKNQQMQNYIFNSSGIYTGGVKSTSGFIPREQLRIIGHHQQTSKQLNEKYKFVDDNIKALLNSDRYEKENIELNLDKYKQLIKKRKFVAGESR